MIPNPFAGPFRTDDDIRQSIADDEECIRDTKGDLYTPKEKSQRLMDNLKIYVMANMYEVGATSNLKHIFMSHSYL